PESAMKNAGSSPSWISHSLVCSDTSAARAAIVLSSLSATPASNGTARSMSPVIIGASWQVCWAACRLGSVSYRQLVEKSAIDEAPSPRFARLERLDDRMAALLEMPGRMLVPRLVAAADVAAAEAQPQVHPVVAGLQAFLAPVAAR